jgi:hypothetical protein
MGPPRPCSAQLGCRGLSHSYTPRVAAPRPPYRYPFALFTTPYRNIFLSVCLFDRFQVFVSHHRADAHQFAMFTLYPMVVLQGVPAFVDPQHRCGSRAQQRTAPRRSRGERVVLAVPALARARGPGALGFNEVRVREVRGRSLDSGAVDVDVDADFCAGPRFFRRPRRTWDGHLSNRLLIRAGWGGRAHPPPIPCLPLCALTGPPPVTGRT